MSDVYILPGHLQTFVVELQFCMFFATNTVMPFYDTSSSPT